MGVVGAELTIQAVKKGKKGIVGQIWQFQASSLLSEERRSSSKVVEDCSLCLNSVFNVSQTRDASLTVRPVPAAFKQIKKVVPQPAYHLPLMTQFQLSVEATAAQMKILIIGPGDSG